MKLDFALTESQFQNVIGRLHGPAAYRPDDPERGFLAMVFTATGAERRTILLGRIIEPLEGDVYWDEDRGLVMSHAYYSRAIDAAQSVPGAGLINVHGHPRPESGTQPPLPSRQDRRSDERELCFVSRALPRGRTTAAAIITPGGGISVREYTFKHPASKEEARQKQYGPSGAKVEYATRIRVVGPGVRLLSGDPDARAEAAVIDTKMTESSLMLWGQAGQRMLGRFRIGIAGLGGVGGIVAEHLARLGVGKLVLVDYDRLEPGNFNRSQGATRREALSRTPKIKVYKRVAKEAATAAEFEVTSYRASVAEKDGLARLLDCDVIIGSADDAFARQVLDHAAYAHLIPVIDGGTTLVGDSRSMRLVAGKSQIAIAAPGHSCLECQGVYTQEEATFARESAVWGRYLYIAGGNADAKKELRAPSVICNNGLVASLIGLRLLAIALGLTPNTVAGLQRYYVEEGVLSWGAIKECVPGCPKASWVGRGDSHFIPTGIDLRWQQVLAEESSAKLDS